MTEAVRILHFCPRHSFSGLESWVLEMVRSQRQCGLDSRLVVLQNSLLHRRALEVEIPVFEVENEGVFALSQAASSAWQRFQFQIMHLHGSSDFKFLTPWLTLNLRKRVRTILQLHIWLSHPKRDPLHRAIYALLDEVWCSSERARTSLFSILPVSSSRIKVMNYGRRNTELEISFLSRADARLELKLPLDALILAAVARLDRGKGTEEFINGSLPVMQSDESLHLVLIGSPTDDPSAQAFAKRLIGRVETLPAPIRSRIHFLGNVDNSYRFLKAFDLFASPAYAECFSLALLEAQLAQLPVIATNSGGSPELVIEGRTGWLCEPQSSTSFETALKKALNDQCHWLDYGRRAAARVKAEFDTDVVMRNIISGYHSLLTTTARDAKRRFQT